ncbi:hypothetical protein BpHYR1_039527 [Brachionus plicatilis]|uniref:Uncharacterized protein n=1 Tax=Brachionus plicatilis TaxID=10195 RepID=A0A3M7QJG3_BRAPC|nr:hypothetical protein BpHYR1_039527 [Brachionus plicatilis]
MSSLSNAERVSIHSCSTKPIKPTLELSISRTCLTLAFANGFLPWEIGFMNQNREPFDSEIKIMITNASAVNAELVQAKGEKASPLNKTIDWENLLFFKWLITVRNRAAPAFVNDAVNLKLDIQSLICSLIISTFNDILDKKDLDIANNMISLKDV